MKKLATFLLLGSTLFIVYILFPKPYHPKGGISKWCKTVIATKNCLGVSRMTQTDDPCTESAVCTGLLFK